MKPARQQSERSEGSKSVRGHLPRPRHVIRTRRKPSARAPTLRWSRPAPWFSSCSRPPTNLRKRVSRPTIKSNRKKQCVRGLLKRSGFSKISGSANAVGNCSAAEQHYVISQGWSVAQPLDFGQGALQPRSGATGPSCRYAAHSASPIHPGAALRLPPAIQR